ncbi:MAG: hypothetical protein K2X81_10520 [Candidatus Obscuribacterales bacterium]|nr:hypothetical protein [Candidatus Obscuribacterales bacterium]
MANEKQFVASQKTNIGHGRSLTIETYSCGEQGYSVRQILQDDTGKILSLSCSCSCVDKHGNWHSDSCYCRDDQDCGCDCSDPERPRAHCR